MKGGGGKEEGAVLAKKAAYMWIFMIIPKITLCGDNYIGHEY